MKALHDIHVTVSVAHMLLITIRYQKQGNTS
jgi:heme/copper-type cytochrome/quinol oxidase subunit 3